MQSDCRGEKRMTSAPKRAMSKRLAATAINQTAQQASPIGIGHIEFVRIQLITASARVTTTSPSILVLYPSSVLEVTMAFVTWFKRKSFAELASNLCRASRFWKISQNLPD